MMSGGAGFGDAAAIDRPLVGLYNGLYVARLVNDLATHRSH